MSEFMRHHGNYHGRGKIGFGGRVINPDKFAALRNQFTKKRSNWLTILSLCLSIGTLAYSVIEKEHFETFKGETRTSHLMMSEKIAESTETLQRVGTVLSFLVSDKEQARKTITTEPIGSTSSVSNSQSPLPLTVVTNSRTAIKMSPEEKAETLMVLSKDLKLVVADIRSDWFQIIAPTGEKGWLPKKQVTFSETLNG